MRSTYASIVAVLALAASTNAETHTVLANTTSFSPDTLTVAPGDTIVWQYNAGYPHTVTSGAPCTADGVFDAPLNGSNPTFTWNVPADASGTIAYFCEPHCNWGMTATLTIVGPTTIHVPSDYATIQGALDAASDGDTVLIAAGRYFEVSLTPSVDNLTIRGEVNADGTPAVTIGPEVGGGSDGDAVMRVKDIEGIVIEHLHLTHGAWVSGGGMTIENASPTVTNCVFSASLGMYGGGGADCNNASPTFTNCVFRDNVGGTMGGGFRSHLGSSPTLIGCTFTGNTVQGDWGYGGGIFAEGQMMLIDCVITGNFIDQDGKAKNPGGGIWCTSAGLTLSGTTVCGNDDAEIFGNWTDLGGNTVADACPGDCAGDLDGNGEVGVDDLLTVLAAYQSNADGDLDGDGDTDVDDLLLLISAWGDCP